MGEKIALSASAAGLIIRGVNESIPELAPAEPRRSAVWTALAEMLQTILIAVLLFLAVNLVTARIRVEGSSMEPSLHDGQMVVVNRLAYRWSGPSRGDIVVFYFPLDPSRRFIKRVIGLPGDSVEAREGLVYVNGMALDEPYLAAPPRYAGTWQVEPDTLFVLGDNRNNSDDSQNWGPLPMDKVIGKAVLVYWPLPDIGLIPHYSLVAAAEG
jgi:signal peptidase I